jgi:uncharacterized protein YbcV (DUF1398 family)
MNKELCRKTTEGSISGEMTFPQVVKELMGIGLESYLVDLVRMKKIFYMPSGETYEENLAHAILPIGSDFSQSEVKAAIADSQKKSITYLQFIDRITQAGVTNYTVYLTGRRAIYTGRSGEQHVEHFPGSV